MTEFIPNQVLKATLEIREGDQYKTCSDCDSLLNPDKLRRIHTKPPPSSATEPALVDDRTKKSPKRKTHEQDRQSESVTPAPASTPKKTSFNPRQAEVNRGAVAVLVLTMSSANLRQSIVAALQRNLKTPALDVYNYILNGEQRRYFKGADIDHLTGHLQQLRAEAQSLARAELTLINPAPTSPVKRQAQVVAKADQNPKATPSMAVADKDTIKTHRRW